VCLACDGQFQPRRPWQRFCSDRCRARSHRQGGTGGASAETMAAGHETLQARIQELARRVEALEARSRSDRLLRHIFHGLERPARKPTGKPPATRNARCVD